MTKEGFTKPEESPSKEKSGTIECKVHVDTSILDQFFQKTEERLQSLEASLKELCDDLDAFIDKIGLIESPPHRNLASPDDYKLCKCCNRQKPVSKFQIVSYAGNGTPLYRAVCNTCADGAEFVNKYGFGNHLDESDLRKLLDCYDHFTKCVKRGGKIDYRQWNVDLFLKRINNSHCLKIVTYDSIVYDHYDQDDEYIGRITLNGEDL